MVVLEYLEASLFIIWFVFTVVECRECYNYKEEPTVRQCSTGCCGEKYQQYCCNATMQIVGSILGGMVVLGAVIAVIYYCYRKKSKSRQMTGQPGLFGRIGFRNRTNHIHQTNQGPPALPPPRGRPFRVPTNSVVPPVGANTYYNPAYNPTGIQQPPPGGQYYSNTMMATAPLPPPYDVSSAPPPYSDKKDKDGVPPPPEYTPPAGHTNILGYKPGAYSDGMPTPAH